MAAKLPIYMDNHSTTQVDPRVVEAMLPYFSEHYGNAASRGHAYGWTAEAAVDRARAQIAELIGGQESEIVFTSGATESNNLALKGVAWAYRKRGDHIITSSTEHKSVIDPARRLEREGYRVTWIRPGADGRVSAEEVVAAMEEGTILVSLMQVNNEIGVVQPIAAIGAAIKARDPGCLLHCDAAQSAGKLPIDVGAMQVDLLSLSAHKMYGPKGVGALWVRRRPRVALTPLVDGGGHERGLRSGTLPVPSIVGFGHACAVAGAELDTESPRVAGLRDRLWRRISAGLAGVTVNGSTEHRVAGNLNLSFAGVDGDALLIALARHVAISSGSACTSATLEPSYVLRAIGVADDLAHASVRFGLGRFTTEAEVEVVADRVIEAVGRLRELAEGEHPG